MRKEKRGLGVDRNGVQKMMRKRDYLADMSGQFGMNLVANLIGQLTYFYTDKVGLAVGGIGIVMLIAKIVDAVTDLWFGNIRLMNLFSLLQPHFQEKYFSGQTVMYLSALTEIREM